MQFIQEWQISPAALDALRSEKLHDDPKPSTPFWVCWFQCPYCKADEFDAFSATSDFLRIWETWGPWEEAGDAVCMGFDLALAAYGSDAA
jgi:hypothetical protein